MSTKKGIILGKPLHLKAFETYPELTVTPEKTIGSGSFGVVYQAVSSDGKKMAIKKVLQDRRYKNRELTILKSLNHPNCLYLEQYFYTPATRPDEQFLNIVTKYYPETIYSMVKRHVRMRQQLPMTYVRLFAYQMCRGLAYIHSKGICHRDIKPQNLLVDPRTGELVVIDFGSAKCLVPTEPNVSYICSRYYRAPELIFGATHYTQQIDIWSMGCVVAEMVLGHPLFPGESGVDQLVEIIRVLGTPTREDIISMNRSYKDYRLPNITTCPWPRVFRSSPPDEFIDFIDATLRYKPEARLKAIECLAHPFFDPLRAPGITLPNGNPTPKLTDFTEEELEGCPEPLRRKLLGEETTEQ